MSVQIVVVPNSEVLALFGWFPIIIMDLIWESQSSPTAFTHSIWGLRDSPPCLYRPVGKHHSVWQSLVICRFQTN